MKRMPPARTRALRLALLSLATGACTMPAHAGGSPLSVGGVAGYGDRANVYGVQVAWAPRLESEFLERNDLDLRFVGQVARWLSRLDQVAHGSLTDGSVTAELRYWQSPPASTRYFVEAGLGLHLISHVQIGKRNLGTAFNFGTGVAAGFTFGPNGRYELAAWLSHVSNAGTEYPNDGFVRRDRFRFTAP
jgi:hypothetical protein